MASIAPKVTSLDAAKRGYHVPYRGVSTACPGCGRSHWIIGRLSAECAFCTTALPLEESLSGAGTFRSRGTAFRATAMGEAA